MFSVYFQLGFQHITDLKGYDHLLFLIALCAVYSYSEWKRVMVLVTAFTIGHSLTLALAGLNILQVNAKLIEVLIPATILLTALKNIFIHKPKEKLWDASYLLPLVFGLIHGMGFSGYFKSLLGREADIVLPLFSFNLGVEVGQLCIVIVFLFLNYLITSNHEQRQKGWNLTISLLAAVVAVYLMINRI